MPDFFILYETSKTGKTVYGFTKDSKIAISELNRLFQIDPFYHKYRYSIELAQYKPVSGFELYRVDSKQTNTPVPVPQYERGGLL